MDIFTAARLERLRQFYRGQENQFPNLRVKLTKLIFTWQLDEEISLFEWERCRMRLLEGIKRAEHLAAPQFHWLFHSLDEQSIPESRVLEQDWRRRTLHLRRLSRSRLLAGSLSNSHYILPDIRDSPPPPVTESAEVDVDLIPPPPILALVRPPPGRRGAVSCARAHLQDRSNNWRCSGNLRH